MKNQNNTEMALARLLLIISALLSFTTLHVVYGGIVCEKLPAEICAFSVSSSGARCVLQKSMLKDGNPHYECQTSEIIVEITINELTQTEECIKNCGVERMTVGMSAESLAESVFTEKLCSPRCYNKCPNIIDFYFNVAAGKGVYLPRLCEAHRSGDRRMISENSLIPVKIPSVPIPEIPIPRLPEVPPVIPSIPIPEVPIPPLPEVPPVIPSIPIPEIPIPPLPEIPVPVAIPP